MTAEFVYTVYALVNSGAEIWKAKIQPSVLPCELRLPQNQVRLVKEYIHAVRD